MANRRLYHFWGNLTAALRTGVTERGQGGGPNFFGALYADPENLKGFLKAMTGISTGANRLIASKFPWKNYKTAVDVGTAQGNLIVQVALANPHISGIGFDLAEVPPLSKSTWPPTAQFPSRVSCRQFLRCGFAQSGCRDDGTHPARLEPRRKCW